MNSNRNGKTKQASNGHAGSLYEALISLRPLEPIFECPGELEDRFLSIAEVAQRLSVSQKWVRKHLDEFPNWRSLDERQFRIPLSDLESALQRWRINKQ